MILGSVDTLDTGKIVGWAYSPDDADDHLLIEAFAGGALRGSTFADLPLAAADAAADKHGFVIAFRRPLAPDQLHGIEVYATALSGERSQIGLQRDMPRPGDRGDPVPSPPQPVGPVDPWPVPPPLACGAGELPLTVTAVIERIGMRKFHGGGWIGSRGGALALCGLTVRTTPPVAIEMREFCADRNDTAAGHPALAGFAIRSGDPRYTVLYQGMFRSGMTVGPLSDGVPCLSTRPDDALTRVQISVRDRDSGG